MHNFIYVEHELCLLYGNKLCYMYGLAHNWPENKMAAPINVLVFTVEPLYNGQVGASAFCPLYGGVLYREVLSIIAFITSNWGEPE